MSNEIAKVSGMTPDQKELVRRAVAMDATDDELAMFIHVANKAGLDPLQKQIWFIKRGGKVTIQAGVDGLQARAFREPGFKGMLVGVVCEKDAFTFDGSTGTVKAHEYNAFADRGAVRGAYAIVHREGMMPFAALVKFSEYYDGNSPLWKNKPNVMIEKVARSTALRRAFPEEFGGLYDPAEMGKDAAPIQVEAEVKPLVYPVHTPPPATTKDAPPLTDLDAVEESARAAGLTAAQVVEWLVSVKRLPAPVASFSDLPAALLEAMAKPKNAAKWIAGTKGRA